MEQTSRNSIELGKSYSRTDQWSPDTVQARPKAKANQTYQNIYELKSNKERGALWRRKLQMKNIEYIQYKARAVVTNIINSKYIQFIKEFMKRKILIKERQIDLLGKTKRSTL